jgi:hypothetical protein
MTRIVGFAADYYLVVPLGSVLALVNTRADSYFTFAHSWSWAVNDVGMTLFFALVMCATAPRVTWRHHCREPRRATHARAESPHARYPVSFNPRTRSAFSWYTLRRIDSGRPRP